MPPYLRLVSEGAERVWELQPGENQVGRNPRGDGNLIVLTGEGIADLLSISRHHVSIRVDPERVTLRKVAGGNIVAVNERELEEKSGPVDLRGGDRLLLGRVLFELRADSPRRPEASGAAAGLAAPPSGEITAKTDAKEIERLGQKYRRLESALSIAQQILRADSLDAALESMLAKLVDAFGLQCGLVADLDQTDGRLRGRAFVGLERIEDLSNVSQSILRQALKSGRPFLMNDASKEERIREAGTGSIDLFNIRQAVCVPLASGSSNLGVIYLDRRKSGPGQPLTRDDEQVLLRVADLIACALASLRDRQSAELLGLLDRAQIVGRSEPMLQLAGRIRKVARALDVNPRAPVLIVGPPGAGKELVARAVRMELRRRERPYLRVNMGGSGANPELAHSAIFGHRKGAFSQAFEDRPGAVGVVEGGVLFLDEVGDMPRVVQRLFKEFLAEETYGTYSRLGEDEHKRQADVVVILATNRDLEDLGRRGEFEADMVRRLFSGHVIRVPALSEHREDIPDIANRYLCLFNERYSRNISLSKEAMDLLCSTTWEYNVGELRSAVHQLVSQAEEEHPLILGRGRVERALRRQAAEAAPFPPGKEAGEKALWEVELDHCLSVWESCERSYRRASERLEIAENTLRKKLIEGLLRRLGGDVGRTARFFGKDDLELEQEISTYRIQRGR